MTVEELKIRMDQNRLPHVIDVREDAELQIARFPFSVQHIPLGELLQRYTEIPADADVVCACRSGGRSAQAVRFLEQRGRPAANLEGGILAWASRVDPSVRRY